MRLVTIIVVVLVLLAAALWGAAQFVSGLIPNGPIATLLGKHKPIKQIIQHGGLPIVGKRPTSTAGCATPGTQTGPPRPPWARCGTPGTRHPGPPGGGPPSGKGPPR